MEFSARGTQVTDPMSDAVPFDLGDNIRAVFEPNGDMGLSFMGGSGRVFPRVYLSRTTVTNLYRL